MYIFISGYERLDENIVNSGDFYHVVYGALGAHADPDPAREHSRLALAASARSAQTLPP